MISKLAVRIGAAGAFAVAALAATSASASAAPLITHTSGPYSSEAACAAAEGAAAAAGEDIVRNCYKRSSSSPVGGSIGWAFDYSTFF
jgi:hypothetical protein